MSATITLNHLTSKCPHCRAEPVSLTIGSEHSHPELGRGETAIYRCGCQLKYVPCIGKIEYVTGCQTQKRSAIVCFKATAVVQYVGDVMLDPASFIHHLKLQADASSMGYGSQAFKQQGVNSISEVKILDITKQ